MGLTRGYASDGERGIFVGNTMGKAQSKETTSSM